MTNILLIFILLIGFLVLLLFLFYYSKRNKAFIEIFKIVIIGAIPLIILAILTKSNIIPRQITTFLSLIILFILGIICFMKFSIPFREFST